ncbi:secretion system X translation initiation factor [Sulfuriferula thiophila]|uniref:secretion system X translation initiation factor n=1 Tax=Sulfuriferula thiophila TaxID=1781211 RepID=UPI0016718F2A|nr:secretion system X translation initiation factor [Sulfuriferula thiophila]
MAVTQKTRWIIIATALLLTLVAVNWVNQAESNDDASTSAPEFKHPAPSRHREEKPEPDAIQLAKLGRAQPGSKVKIVDLFTSKSWYVPPPPPKPAPPPPPAAPPLPFTYIGKLVEDGAITVFLSKQDRNYVIKTGDVIDGTYRVDTVMASALTLTYLPLNIKQSMPIGDSH